MQTIATKLVLAFLLLFALGAKAQTVTQIVNGGTGSHTSQGAATNIVNGVTAGDAGALVNAAFGSNNVVVLTAGNWTATTTITIPNAATGFNGIPGTLRILGTGTVTVPQILFQDSTTTESQSGSLECPDGATIQLAASSNNDLISDTNFSSLTGTSNAYGLNRTRIDGRCILDGNKANNSSGWVLRLYGRGLEVKATAQNGKSGGVWLENHDAASYTTPADDVSQFGNDVRAIDNGGDGVYIPQGQGWSFINVVAWGNTGWGIETAAPTTASYIQTFLNGSGGCHVATGGGLNSDNANCTSAAGYGLFIDSGTAYNTITGIFDCNGCTGVEVKSSDQQIVGSIQNSTHALVIDGGSLTGVLTVANNLGALVTLTSEGTPSWLTITGDTTSNTACFSTTPAGTDTIFATTQGGSAPCTITQTPPPTEVIANSSQGWLALIPNSGFNYLQSGTTNGAAAQNLSLSGPAGLQLIQLNLYANLTATNGSITIPTGKSYQINGAPILPGTLTGYNGNSSGIDIPLSLAWTDPSMVEPVCHDTNGNLTDNPAICPAVPLTGITGSIGGSPLTAGQCATGTATLGSSATGHPGTASTSDGSNIQTSGSGLYTTPQVTVSGTTATVQICDIIGGTPTAKTYNVTVF